MARGLQLFQKAGKKVLPEGVILYLCAVIQRRGSVARQIFHMGAVFRILGAECALGSFVLPHDFIGAVLDAKKILRLFGLDAMAAPQKIKQRARHGHRHHN